MFETSIALPVATVASGLVFAIFLKKFNLVYQFLHKTDKLSKRHGGELVANVLKAHNIHSVFTLPGGHISPIAVACEKLGIKVIDTRHEVTAAFAADAYARLTRGIGVVMVTAGPGLTNVVTAIKNAQMAESPVLLIGGAAASLLKGRGALQDIDQMSLVKPICKYCVSVTKVRDIVPALRKAISIAQSGVPAPVFVELPVDTLYQYELIKKELGIKEGGGSLMQKVVNWYLNNYINDLFCGAWEERDPSPIEYSIPKATEAQIQTCVKLLSRAKKPVILLGSQSILPPVQIESLVCALNSMGVPCFLGGMARGLLGRNNKIHIRQNRSQVLKEADLIILAGTVCDFRLNYGRSIGRKAKVVAINRGKRLLNLNKDMFWSPTVSIQGDCADFLVRLQKSLPGYKADPSWAAELKERETTKEQENFKKSLNPVDRFLNPMKVLYKIEEILPDNAILIADGGDFVATASYILRPRGPLQWLDPGAFGTLGVGGGFALGAKAARPHAQIWIIYGDGSLGYSMMEYDTYRRFKMPVLSIVGNDACWTQIAREQLPMLGSTISCMLEFSSYEKVAEALGAHGELVTEGDENIDKALERSTKALDEKSALINFHIGKTDFRDGSISV